MSRYWIFSQMAEALVDAILNLADEIVTRLTPAELAHSGAAPMDRLEQPAPSWLADGLERVRPTLATLKLRRAGHDAPSSFA